MENNKLTWKPINQHSADPAVVTTTDNPFQADGGIRLLTGNIGRSVIKVSAVAEEHRVIEAPAMVFDDQLDLKPAFDNGAFHHPCSLLHCSHPHGGLAISSRMGFPFRRSHAFTESDCRYRIMEIPTAGLLPRLRSRLQ